MEILYENVFSFILEWKWFNKFFDTQNSRYYVYQKTTKIKQVQILLWIVKKCMPLYDCYYSLLSWFISHHEICLIPNYVGVNIVLSWAENNLSFYCRPCCLMKRRHKEREAKLIHFHQSGNGGICYQKTRKKQISTINEQLLAIHGKCRFRMYISNKHAKLVMACDTGTNYMFNAVPYM